MAHLSASGEVRRTTLLQGKDQEVTRIRQIKQVFTATESSRPTTSNQERLAYSSFATLQSELTVIWVESSRLSHNICDTSTGEDIYYMCSPVEVSVGINNFINNYCKVPMNDAQLPIVEALILSCPYRRMQR